MVDLDKIKERAQSEGVSIKLILKEYIQFFIKDFIRIKPKGH